MNLYLKHTLFYLLGISYALISSAQSNPDKLQCKVTGRMLLDGGVYLKNDNNFGNGVEFSDLRIGAKVAYQNWDMKLEIGYTGNKATIKMLLQSTHTRTTLYKSDNSTNRLV